LVISPDFSIGIRIIHWSGRFISPYITVIWYFLPLNNIRNS
jgi:hypothetical protein